MAQREQAEKELIPGCAGSPRRCAKIPDSHNEYLPHPMLDIQLLRKDLDGVAKRLADRGYTLDVAAFTALEAPFKPAPKICRPAATACRSRSAR
jgi:hypothetical protein